MTANELIVLVEPMIKSHGNKKEVEEEIKQIEHQGLYFEHNLMRLVYIGSYFNMFFEMSGSSLPELREKIVTKENTSQLLFETIAEGFNNYFKKS